MNAPTHEAVATGVVSLGCHKCESLMGSLAEAFARHGVSLSFNPTIWDHEPESAARIAMENGIDDIPAFIVGGKVFRHGFSESDVRDAAAAACGR